MQFPFKRPPLTPALVLLAMTLACYGCGDGGARQKVLDDAQQSVETPVNGANLWGYGVYPPTRPYDYSVSLPANDSYANGYWARSGFVNRGGPVPTAWTGTAPWLCRCMLKPEFGV
ncbi:MAG: hypothetical protein ABI614_24440, partial [Planctomycetota bacterium]